MTESLKIRSRTKKVFPYMRLFRAVAYTSALLLYISGLVPSAQPQELPYSVVEQRPGTQRVLPPNMIPPAVQRSEKQNSKYDVDRIGQRGIGTGRNLYSLERERRLGSASARDIEAHTKLITDPVITEYVNGLGQSIVRHSDDQLPFTIKVIDSDEIYAFVLPGGYLYVNSGLITASDSEAELASILAHEIAHVAARHDARIQRRRGIWKLVSFCSGPAGFAVQVAGFLSSMKLNRDAEREADLLGLEYQYATGYDPQAFVQFFEKLQAREEERHNLIAKVIATHPMTEERIRRAQKVIATLLPPKAEYIIDTSDFEQVKSRLASFRDSRRESEDWRPVLHRRGPQDAQVR
jgi:predicted Zn-dependent protease